MTTGEIVVVVNEFSAVISRCKYKVLRHAMNLVNTTFKKGPDESSWEQLHPNTAAPSSDGLVIWKAHFILDGDAALTQCGLPHTQG